MAAWNPIQFDKNEPNLMNLIGIEECKDYNEDLLQTLKDDKANASKKIKKKKSRSTKNNKNTLLTPSKQGSTVLATPKVPKPAVNIDAWNTFNLPEEILTALKDLEFSVPTHIQSLVLPPAIFGRKDILGAAETGSGKTLSYGIPIISGIINLKKQENNNNKEIKEITQKEDTTNSLEDVNKLYALILAPTRELAIQVQNHLKMAAKYTDIKIAAIVGGMAVAKQERILKQSPEIVVATPGRFWELYQSGEKHLQNIQQIRYLVIDETDRMLERGHFQELYDILEKINENQNKRQNFVFSATLTMIHDVPKRLINKISRKRKIKEMTTEQKLQKIIDLLGMVNPKVIDITKGIGISETLSECRISCSLEEKDFYVYYFLSKYEGKTLIFCNSIGCVKRLSTLLSLLDCKAYPLHSLMQQRQRLKNLDRFKESGGVLIATDVAARGLDIPNIEHVIHYQVPRTSESYVHRSGRTARASFQGLTILLIDSSELHNYLKICKTLNKTEDLPTFPVDMDHLNIIKDKVKLARELDMLQLKIRKTNASEGWLEKAAKEMDIILDDDLKVNGNATSKEQSKLKKIIDDKRKHLRKLLDIPIISQNSESGKYPFYMTNPLLTSKSTSENDNSAINLIKKPEVPTKRKRTIALYRPKKMTKNNINKQ